MLNIFDKNSSFQKILSNSGQKCDINDPWVDKWFMRQIRQIDESPGGVAAGAAIALVINSAEPEAAVVAEADEKEPYVKLVEPGEGGNKASITVPDLPGKAECMVMLLDETILSEIKKYLAPESSDLKEKGLARLLFLDHPKEKNFHRDVILTSPGLPKIFKQAGAGGILKVEIEIPQKGFAWTNRSVVLVVYNGTPA